MITTVIIDKLCKKEQLSSHCLIFRNVSSQIIFNNLIQSFILTVCLKMISSREMLFNHLNLADFLSKIWSNVRIFIYYDASWKIKTTFNMLKKKLCKICTCNVISDEYKQYILHNIANYSQNTVKFLIILHWQKQFCDLIQTNFLEW